MIFSKRKQLQRREQNIKTSRNKTYSYHSARRSTGDSSNTNDNDLKDKANGASGKLSKLLNAIIFVAVFSSLAYLSYLNTDPIIELEQQAIPRSETAYYQAVRDEINSSIVYKNKLSFNTDQFEDRMTGRFPEIEDIVVEIPVFRHRPTINISVAEPSARLVTNDRIFILDGEGRALFEEEQINDQFDTSKLVSINDASGHPVTLGSPVLTQQQIIYVREIINQGNVHNLPARTFNLEFGGSAVDVRFEGTDYIVKFSFYEDPARSSGAYFALKEEISKNNVTIPEQYIDLRIPDRAYIK